MQFKVMGSKGKGFRLQAWADSSSLYLKIWKVLEKQKTKSRTSF
jgi:hypothetical protein